MCSIAAVSGTQQNLKLFLSLDRHFTKVMRRGFCRLSVVQYGRALAHGWLPTAFQEVRDAADHTCWSQPGIPFLFLTIGRWRCMSRRRYSVSGLGGDYMIIPLMTRKCLACKLWEGCWDNPDRRRHRGSRIAMADWPSARRDRKLFRKLFRAGRHRVARRLWQCWVATDENGITQNQSCALDREERGWPFMRICIRWV